MATPRREDSRAMNTCAWGVVGVAVSSMESSKSNLPAPFSATQAW
jgi:hypothetical protein